MGWQELVDVCAEKLISEHALQLVETEDVHSQVKREVERRQIQLGDPVSHVENSAVVDLDLARVEVARHRPKPASVDAGFLQPQQPGSSPAVSQHAQSSPGADSTKVLEKPAKKSVATPPVSTGSPADAAARSPTGTQEQQPSGQIPKHITYHPKAPAKPLIPGGPCENPYCGVCEAPQWRRIEKKLVCNRCGMYYHRHARFPDWSYFVSKKNGISSRQGAVRPVVITHRPARPDGPLGRVPALAPPPVITVHHRPAVAVGVQEILGRGPVSLQPQSQSQVQLQVQPRLVSFQPQGPQQVQVQALAAQQRQQQRQQELEQQQSKVQVHVQENGLPIRLTVQQLLQRVAGNQQQQQQTQRTEPAHGPEPQRPEVQLSPAGLRVLNGMLGRAQGAERPSAAAVTAARSQQPPSPHRAESGGSPRSDSTFAPSVGAGTNRGAGANHERGLGASLGRQGQEVESDQQVRVSAAADGKANAAQRSMLADAAAAAGGGSGIAAALKLLAENGYLPARLAQAAAEAAPVKGAGSDVHANGHGSSPVAAALRRGAQEVLLQQGKRGSWDGDGYPRQQQQRSALLGHGREEQQLPQAERQVYKQQQQQQDVHSSRDVAMHEAREQARGAPAHVYRNAVVDTVMRAEGRGGLHASPLCGNGGFGLVAGKRLSGGDDGEEAAEQRKRARYTATEDAVQQQQQQQMLAGRRVSEAEGSRLVEPGQLQEALQRQQQQQQQQQGFKLRQLQGAPPAQAHAQQELGRPGLSPLLATLLQQNKQRQQQQQEALQQQQQQQQQRNPASANGSRPMGTSLLDTIAALQHQQQRQQLQQPGMQRHGHGGAQGQESGMAAQQHTQQRVMVRGQPLYLQAPKAEQYDVAYDNAQGDARRNGGMAGGLLLRDLEQRALLVQQQQQHQQHQQQPVDYGTQAQLRHSVVDAAAAAPRGVVVSLAPASGQYGNGQQYQVVQVRGGGAVGNGRGMQQGGYYAEDGALGGQVQIAGRKGPHVRVEGGSGGSVKAVVQGGNGGLVMLPVLDLGKPSATMAF